MESMLGDPVAPGQVGDLRSCLMLLDRGNDLLLGKPIAFLPGIPCGSQYSEIQNRAWTRLRGRFAGSGKLVRRVRFATTEQWRNNYNFTIPLTE
jgi:hypothetical protein